MITYDEFIANRPPAFDLSGRHAVGHQSVMHMIRNDLLRGVDAGLLPQGAKFKVKRTAEHPRAKIGVIRIGVLAWSGAVFTDECMEYVLDRGFVPAWDARALFAPSLYAVHQIAMRHNYEDNDRDSGLWVGYFLRIDDNEIKDAAYEGLREEWSRRPENQKKSRPTTYQMDMARLAAKAPRPKRVPKPSVSDALEEALWEARNS